MIRLARSRARVAATADRAKQRGQILILLVLSIFVLTGICAIVVDISWYWANTLRVQRAADAAALAGAVWLPGDKNTAYQKAREEATKNGYTGTDPGVTVTPVQDGQSPRRLGVTISAPVGTYFMRIFGINSIQATRLGKAEFVLPVPMGSPENYYGVFGKVRHPGGGVTTVTPHNATTADIAPSSLANPQNWTDPTRAYTSNDFYATKASTINPYQGYDGFVFPALPAGSAIDAVWVSVEGRADATGCQVGIEVATDARPNNPNWTNSGRQITMPRGTTPAADSVQLQPTVGNPSTWGRTWNLSDLANLGVRLRYLGGCSGGTVSVDQVKVSVSYSWNTSTFTPDSNLDDPYDNALTPRGFWGTFMTQGGRKINGDAYLPHFDGSGTNAEYNTEYYNYAVEMPPGTVNGELWIYDPVFCATDGSGQYGTGDRFLGNQGRTYAFYTLYNTKNTPYDLQDDLIGGPVASLAYKPTQIWSDPDLDGPTPSGYHDCSNEPAHNHWVKIAGNLQGGITYRLHTTSTETPGSTTMDSTDGHNSFALWSRAPGGTGTPRIYGIGAMEAFTPLEAGRSAEFYLAQIDKVHAGKTMEVKLWDPGDTGVLPATLQILQPIAGGAPTPARFDYTAKAVASGASNCNGQRGTKALSVLTNTGSSQVFGGCWVTIQIPLTKDYLGQDYTAPTSAGDPGPGWWKIRYIMGGRTSDDPAFDLTTWQVDIIGNPVHLVVP